MFSRMPNLTELCTAMSHYDQRLKSQQNMESTNRKYSTVFNFWTLGFLRMGRSLVRCLGAPEDTFITVGMSNNALFYTKAITISGLCLLQDVG